MKKTLIIFITFLLLIPTMVLADDNDIHNNNLKSLEIEGYDINFDKYKKIYSIEVPEEVNILNINAEKEAQSSTIKIMGADDLESNNNKVTIEVTAQNKDVKTYIINIDKIKKVKDAKKGNFEIKEEYKTYGIYALIAVAALILLIFIIVKIRDKIIEKGIDKF